MLVRFLLAVFIVANLNAVIITQDVNDNNKSKFMMALPYAVSTESTASLNFFELATASPAKICLALGLFTYC